MADQGSTPTADMRPCPLCKEPVQAGAVKCPHCREFIDGRAAPKAAPQAPPRTSALRNCVALLLLVVCGGFLWYFWSSRENKDNLNRILATTGVTVTPWIDRADTAMRDMLNKPRNRENVAGSILGITHPSGSNASMTKWTVERQGQTLSVTFDVAWKGGLVGTDYMIQVVWRCNEAGPIGVTVTKDDAPIGQDEVSLKKLDEYFRTGVWPALFSNTGGK